MKKLIITFSLFFLLAGCTVISEYYTEPRVRSERYVEYYDHNTYYSYYIPCPIYGGFYFYYSPYYYGYYNYFRYYRNYPHQWRYGQIKKKTVITKKQLKARSSTASKTAVRKTTVKKSTPTTATKSTTQKKSATKKKR